MDNSGKEGSFTPVFIAMIISLVIAFFWDRASFIKSAAHTVLNPTSGALLNWNLDWGMVLIVLIISFFMTIIQKYATDQETLRDMKKEQKRLSEEMKQFRNNPEKFMELQKESMKFMAPMMKLSMRPIIYTAIPLILFFRWFMDYFATAGGQHIFGFFSWFWFYLLGSMIFSSLLRKWMNVV